MKAEVGPITGLAPARKEVEGAAGPDPKRALQLVLATLQPDGSIIEVDDETQQCFVVAPYPPVLIDDLCQEVWCWHLLAVAQGVRELCGHIALGTHPHATTTDIQRMQSMIGHVAHYLSAYRHVPDFLAKAISLITKDERGVYFPLQLPGGSWAYDPENIKFREEPLHIGS